MKKWFGAALALVCSAAFAQTPAGNPTLRLRGSIQSFDGATLVIKERGGEVLSLLLSPDFSVSEVVPVELSSIKAGSYIGTAAMPAPDGSLKALEVVVFPEAARGVGEGSRAWDLLPGSTMTNATVADVVAAPQGRTLTLRYKDGEKVLDVPVGVPVVTYQLGDKSLLVSGAKVMVTARLQDGKPTASRVLAGRNGFAPPM
jgi:hypothetical protein